MMHQMETQKPAGAHPETALGAGEKGSLQRGQFTFYHSFFEAVDSLPKSRQLEAYRAIVRYALFGVEPRLSGSANSVFSAVRPVLEASRIKAEARLKKQTAGESEPTDARPVSPNGRE